MKLSRNTTYLLYAALLMAPATVMAQNCHEVKLAANKIQVSNVQVAQQNNALTVSMDLNLDSLNLPTNTQLVYTPIFKSQKLDYKLPEIVINGKRQQIMYERGVGNKHLNLSPKAMVVRRNNKQAQTLKYTASIPVAGVMKNYDLNMHEDLCGCGNLEEGNDFHLRHRRQPQAVFVRPAVEAIKVRHLDKRAYIDFPVNKIELHADYRRNPAQLDSIVRTINALKDDKNLEVSGINIHGYASPESPYSHNDYLAKNRAKTLTDYVRRMVALPTQLFTVSSTAEDWDGLRNYLKESNLEHKAEWMMKNIRENEWISDGTDGGWFNGYYDNNGRPVERCESGDVRMMLTGQVFAIMSGTAKKEQIKAICNSADKYLFDQKAGGYRLNTDFKEEKFDLGRMFGFAYGEKENGAVFSHMAVMYANALYKQGFWHQATTWICSTCRDISLV